MSNFRLRQLCFTINNPSISLDEFKSKLISLDRVNYAIFQLEIGESGTPHIQGYMELSKQTRVSWLQSNVHQGMHVEKRKGTRTQAREYCRKEETRTEGPVEVGAWVEDTKVNRIDLDRVAKCVREGGLRRAAEEYPDTFIRHSRGLRDYGFAVAPKKRPMPRVVLLFGLPGCGKTRYVVDKYCADGLYIHEPGSTWFDGYEHDPVVLFDDFAGASSGFRLDYTLRLLDRYVMRIPVKGGHTFFVPEKIYITTNIHPFQWFKWDNRLVQYSALARRIRKVICFKDGKPYYADQRLFFSIPNGPVPGSVFEREALEEVSTDADE